MAGLRNNNNTQNAQWADYVGDILRGAQPINQLVPQHPYLNDVPLIDELRHQNTHHVIPLTLDVAKKILSPITSFDYIHFITTHPSGIKDTLAWLVNAGKFFPGAIYIKNGMKCNNGYISRKEDSAVK